MKKFLSFLLAFTMLLAFSSCEKKYLQVELDKLKAEYTELEKENEKQTRLLKKAEETILGLQTTITQKEQENSELELVLDQKIKRRLNITNI